MLCPWKNRATCLQNALRERKKEERLTFRKHIREMVRQKVQSMGSP
jgi:hypothetical protein